MPELKDLVSSIPRIRKSTVASLTKLGITTIEDLLFYYPYKYIDFSKLSLIKDIREDQTVTIKATVKSITNRFSFRSRLSVCEALVSDATGSIKVIWFNQPYIKNYLLDGTEVLLSGKASFYKTLQLQNPVYEKAEGETIHTGRIVPVYHQTQSLPNRTIRRFIWHAIPSLSEIIDPLPLPIQKNHQLLSLAEALRQVHFPDTPEKLEQAKARITFDEAFIQQLAVAKHKQTLRQLPAPAIPVNVPLIKKALLTLPFTLTNGQKKALWQIVQDMEVKHPMHRLLEGDVGSGKTLVALIAGLVCMNENFQAILLAPTEILAKQHYDSVREFLKQLPKPYNNIQTALLTNQYRLVDEKSTTKLLLNKKIQTGKVEFLVATHAIFYSTLKFYNLGLVIIDEQHRFGVQQRAELAKPFQSYKQKKLQAPHLLSMTATPIPRTLALTAFGDLDISILDELPHGRKPITTTIAKNDERKQTYEFIKAQLKLGRQAFIIAPRVEEDSQSIKASVKQMFEEMSKIFTGYKLGLLYGNMKGSDKETVMTSFNAGEVNILVATSVIEIGIDVPNATVIVIEGAENFGLAQLHQLRGRVGRGKHQSYCFLFSSNNEPENNQRLQFFATTTDGFKLAEFDLKNRGMGSLFGEQQTGFAFKFSQYLTLETLKMAKASSEEILSADPELTNYPALQTLIDPYLNKIHLE